jgi:hypothetical protein
VLYARARDGVVCHHTAECKGHARSKIPPSARFSARKVFGEDPSRAPKTVACKEGIPVEKAQQIKRAVQRSRGCSTEIGVIREQL